MSEAALAETRPIDIRDVERFIYREARLLDEGRFRDWLALWRDDGIYWVPVKHGDTNPAHEVSIIYDDYIRLEQRVDRLLSGSVLAVQGTMHMRRVVSNIEIEKTTADGTVAEANFVLGISRSAEQQLWIGRSIYTLAADEAGIRMVRKKVLLINSEHEMPLLQFLI
jgi:3-phenylpropionate/cinnamic acid dioxygenase small subunit